MRIVICSNNIELTSKLEMMILQYQKEFYCHFEIDIFHDSNRLKKHLLKFHYQYDLLFLDHNLQNSKETIWYQRDRYLIYIFDRIKDIDSILKNCPIDILVVPFTYNDIREILLQINDHYLKENNFFIYKFRNYMARIPYHNILYFESHNKKIYIHLANQEVKSCYGKLNDLYENKIEIFIRIHQSYLVNIRYIIAISSNEVILTNQITLPISQTRKSLVKHKWEIILKKDESYHKM